MIVLRQVKMFTGSVGFPERKGFANNRPLKSKTFNDLYGTL